MYVRVFSDKYIMEINFINITYKKKESIQSKKLNHLEIFHYT